MKSFKAALMPGFKMLMVMTVICGFAYTLLVTGIAQLFFPEEANGSIVTVALAEGGEKQIGSKLIGQGFTEPKYLLGRPNTGASASQLSPISSEQKELVLERIANLEKIDPMNKAEIPMELVTASGSGVDPEISVATALYQVGRIANERGISEKEVEKVIQNNTIGTIFGKIGEPRVNVLGVNMQLDGLKIVK
ncbi:potassium-transporting ATPase subunit C [Carnobacterium maltaromaticum]|uniref:potassium-transporting ATPase subunit C n=1 Tax=Carnobacterium maltaromaticum TaxID=2751 RepID=UPI000C77F1A2|nr:potassium-transporting ATPase subunit C [Carnobacterium maltaromaticum]PLS39171.1 potassium-transporting ATPase subunit C [Carnobacterium maltaromaticum]PLS39981.1 potassium-transporting ATPase subunit C [Carnobacterium maltaromaticum]PLS40318.1 potassium-transporting ATPase subunit C [Carnobacterium maltaromaticum]PLS45960.1 potassium-transporting ATPase subunit C [Carnobacterium maltaromaticum]PLS47112.1 potassium-transporting ATPase subunit C [Carnobacterium maltaromaticum]